MPLQHYFSPETLPPTRGYSQVVKVDSTVYIAGQVGITVDGNVASKDDATAQARQIWQNLEAAVKSAGGAEEGWQIHHWASHVEAVLNAALQGDDGDAAQDAKELINRLGSRGFLQFAKLLRE